MANEIPRMKEVTLDELEEILLEQPRSLLASLYVGDRDEFELVRDLLEFDVDTLQEKLLDEGLALKIVKQTHARQGLPIRGEESGMAMR
jgi:hypothetical protein